MIMILKRGDTVRVLLRLSDVMCRPIAGVMHWFLFQRDSGLGDGIIFTDKYFSTYDSICLIKSMERCKIEWLKGGPQEQHHEHKGIHAR